MIPYRIQKSLYVKDGEVHVFVADSNRGNSVLIPYIVIKET